MTPSTSFGTNEVQHGIRQILDAAFNFGLTATEFKVYFYLVRLADGDRSCSPTLEKIAADCKIKSRNTVKRAIEMLIERGMVRRLPKEKSYTYCLTDPLDWVEVSQTHDQKLIASQEHDQKLINEQQDSIHPL